MRRTCDLSIEICSVVKWICQGWPLVDCRPPNRPLRSYLNTVWLVMPKASAAPWIE